MAKEYKENELETPLGKIKFYSRLAARATMMPTIARMLVKGAFKAAFNGGNLDQAARDMEQSGDFARAERGIARDSARMDRIERTIDTVKKKLHLKR